MENQNSNELTGDGSPLNATPGSRPDYSVFPNGTSFMIWTERNCDRCIKGPKEGHVGHNKACPLEDAIALASVTDGTLLHDGHTPHNKAAAIAKRLNWDGHGYLEHDCPEFVP